MSGVLSWLDSVAQTHPNEIAYEFNEDSITFLNLKKRAISIGKRIMNYAESKKPIAVMASKSIDTIVAYFGVLYSGHSYAPIDLSMPKGRINEILAHLNPEIILTLSKDYYDDLNQSGVKVLLIDDLVSDEENDEKLNLNVIGTDPAYIIFTSGSTGKPKGVVTSHNSIMTYISAYAKVMKINENDVIANQSPLDYIAAIRDIYLPIYSGCKTVLFDKRLYMMPNLLVEEMNKRRITCAGWSAASLETLSKLHIFSENRRPNCLRALCFSGSVLSTTVLREWQIALPNVKFINQYGPTEATASCTYYEVDHLFSVDEDIPIGVPYDEYRVFILDNEKNKESSVNEVGEICVSGNGVTLGYYDNIAQTAEHFVQNPINMEYREIIYKTGDYGRIDKDGCLWFHGRMDRQTKIMGHRVELDEIEKYAKCIELVNECACIFHENAGKLFLFYSGNCSEGAILKELKVNLPSFMLPRHIIKLNEIPKLPNGKKDYKKLQSEVL